MAPRAGTIATIPQLVPKFSTPHITLIIRGVRLNNAPYPEPIKVETIQNRSAWFWITPAANKTCPRDSSSADTSKNVILEIVNRPLGGKDESELLADW